MHYKRKKQIRIIPIQKEQAKTDPTVLSLLEQIAHQTAQDIPCDIDETTLSDSDVNIIINKMMEYRKTLFKNIPLGPDFDPRFVYNIPKSFVKAIDWFDTRKYDNSCPEILNPAILLYMLLQDNPMDSMGEFWRVLIPLLDDNREVIEEDAQAYVADLTYDPESDGESETE